MLSWHNITFVRLAQVLFVAIAVYVLSLNASHAGLAIHEGCPDEAEVPADADLTDPRFEDTITIFGKKFLKGFDDWSCIVKRSTEIASRILPAVAERFVQLGDAIVEKFDAAKDWVGGSLDASDDELDFEPCYFEGEYEDEYRCPQLYGVPGA